MNSTQKMVVFLAHTSENDPFVQDLRLRLERRKYTVLEDSTTFRPGDDLPKEVKEAIDRADHVVVVVSADVVKSGWVKTELRYAREIAQQRDGFRVIPLQLPDASTSELRANLSDEMRAAPLRVLIVCARPESDEVEFIDHRVSVRPLIEALNALGDLASYDILSPPTFPALRDRLREALASGKPYHIVHFDGHGV